MPNNQIATVNGVSYSYDLSGNLTADGTHNYQYDAASRMVSVDGGSTTSSSYDSANRRVKKVAGGVTTHYIWEGSPANNPGTFGGTTFWFGGAPWWMYSLGDFLSWLDSIQVPKPEPEKDHLA